MRETTEYKKLQRSKRLLHGPHKHQRNTPLAETHALKSWGGTLEHQSPSVVAQSIHGMVPQISGRESKDGLHVMVPLEPGRSSEGAWEDVA